MLVGQKGKGRGHVPKRGGKPVEVVNHSTNHIFARNNSTQASLIEFADSSRKSEEAPNVIFWSFAYCMNLVSSILIQKVRRMVFLSIKERRGRGRKLFNNFYTWIVKFHRSTEVSRIQELTEES